MLMTALVFVDLFHQKGETMPSVQVAVTCINGLPSSLRGQHIAVSLETQRHDSPVLSRVVILPSEDAISYDQNTMESVELDGCLATFTVDNGPLPSFLTSGISGEQQRTASHDFLKCKLSLFLLVPFRHGEDQQSSTPQRINETNTKCTPLLISAVNFQVDLQSLLYLDKVQGKLLGAAIGKVSLVFSVVRDQEEFGLRLTQFFRRVNPSKADNVDTIIRDVGVDEVTVFSKLHRKYADMIPEFTLHGTFEDRIQNLFQLYDIGTQRAAYAMLDEWSGRELEAVANVTSDCGPEPWEIPPTMRLAAFCGVHGVDAAQFRSWMYVVESSPPWRTAADLDRLFQQLRSQFGLEPNPTTYLFPETITNDEFYFLFHDALSRRNMAIAQSSEVRSVREYLNQQFENTSDADAYLHLRDEQQTVSMMRQLQSASSSWPFDTSTNELLQGLQQQSSFVYSAAAQKVVTGETDDQSTTMQRRMTMVECEKQQAVLRKFHEVISTNHFSTQWMPYRAVVVSSPAMPTSSSSRISPTIPEDRSSPRGGVIHSNVLPNHPQSTATETASALSAPSDSPVPLYRSVIPQQQHQPPVGVLSGDTSGPFPGSAPRQLAAPVLSARSAAPFVLSMNKGAQTNPWTDLDEAGRAMFLLSDTQSARYAWHVFQDNLEFSHRISLESLYYMTDDAFRRLCDELNVPKDLFERLRAERQTTVYGQLSVMHFGESSDEGKRVLDLLIQATKHSLRRMQIIAAPSIHIVASHPIHQAVFLKHVMTVADEATPSQGSSTLPKLSSATVDMSPYVASRVFLVRCSNQISASNGDKSCGLWNTLAFGLGERRVRFYHNFWTAIRGAYRKLVAEVASSNNTSSTLPPIKSCAFDVFLCDIVIGARVLRTTSHDIPEILPHEFDSVEIAMDDETEASYVTYNPQHVLVREAIGGLLVDSSITGCCVHPEVPSAFGSGQAMTLIHPERRSLLEASSLLCLQAAEPLCLSCLVERALLRDDACVRKPSPSPVAPVGHTTQSDLFPPSFHFASGSRGFTNDVSSHYSSLSATEALSEAWKKFRQGSTSQCFELLSYVADTYHQTSEAYEAMGCLCEIQDRHYVNAATHYREACRLNPRNTSAMCRLANVLETKLSQPNEALRYFEIAAAYGDHAAARRVMIRKTADHNTSSSEDGSVSESVLQMSRRYPRPSTTGSSRQVPNVSALSPPVRAGAVFIPSSVSRSKLF